MHRIAVVDDDITFVEMLTEVLALEGYAVTGITSAADARATLSAAHPDLILLDLRMEQSDSGSHLLGELERDAALRGVPIVVCTADLRQVEALRPQLDARGVSILLKPFDLTTLFECVQRFLPPAAAGGA